MKELKVGMYVRTKNGIAKIIGFTKNYNPNYFHLDRNIIDEEDYLGSFIYCYKFYENQILKASNSIIDLIEVGDVLEINNEKYEVIYDESYKKLGILIPDKKELAITHSSLDYIFEKYKVSVVTKEQFNSVKYEVE